MYVVIYLIFLQCGFSYYEVSGLETFVPSLVHLLSSSMTLGK